MPILGSCTVVVTTSPISTTSDPRDKSVMEGVWLKTDEEDSNPFSIVFDENGMAHMASIVWSDADQEFIIEKTYFITARFGKKKYLSVSKSYDPDAYALLEGGINDNSLYLCIPNSDLFEKAIENKELSGEITSSNSLSKTITITSTQAELRRYLIKNENKPLFECEPQTSNIIRILDKAPDSNAGLFEGCEGTVSEIKKCAEERIKDEFTPRPP